MMRFFAFLFSITLYSYALAADPVYVYVVSYGRSSGTSGDVATAQDVGRQVSAPGTGNTAGAAIAVGAMLASAVKPIDTEAIKISTVVGLNSRCEPTEISFPLRNWHYPKEGDRETKLNSALPMRWMQLSKNDQGEYVLDPLKEKAIVRKSPCWAAYIEQWQKTERKGKFDPETWYQ